MSKMTNNPIVRALYVAKTEELYIQFANPVVLKYDTVAFVEVPFGAARRFKDAADRDSHFNEEIRTKYKFRAVTDITFAEVQIPEVYGKQFADIPSYAEYCAKLEKEMQQKDINAMNAIS